MPSSAGQHEQRERGDAERTGQHGDARQAGHPRPGLDRRVGLVAAHPLPRRTGDLGPGRPRRADGRAAAGRARRRVGTGGRRWRGGAAAGPGRGPRGRRRRRSRPRPRPMRSRPRSAWRVADRRPAGRRRSPQDRGPRPTCSPAARTRLGCDPAARLVLAGTGRPGRRRRPVARRVAPDRRVLGRSGRWRVRTDVVGRVVIPGGSGPDRRGPGDRSGPGRRVLAGSSGVGPRLGRLAPRPVLERRADGERARQAVRLLVRERARRRRRFGEAAMAVVGTRRRANRGRPRTRRMDRPGHRPCWAALAQSSPAMIPGQPAVNARTRNSASSP